MIAFRSALFQLYFLLLTLAMGLGALPIRVLRQERTALAYAKLWCRLVLAGLRLCGIRVVVEGHERLPAGPCLIASQHQSFFDGFVWMNLVPKPAYIIKQELTRVPLVGPMLLLAGMIPVMRQAGARALRNLMAATQEAFAEGRQIVIFPEGTRTIPGARVPLQPGIVALAKQSPVPVVPVATNSGLFWPRSGWRKTPGVITVAIGNPLPPTEGRSALIAAITAQWEELCARHNLPLPVDNSVSDMRVF
ncbi:lysophospholipid acyltransferase family protein [Acidomonas methanolica]|uniref:lysophospholipid acyltransferase family protein n=1 Tax=Acidomonas methanolica TaxID=437 RepID=UPI002119C34D|nr:lysophospholipid acyltransferase family protein [Acidomonas methanolica]MCQ9155492.1 1-acyl-sn-glycerol-3-phosphate acyltransferase [Acidomonas methanolica]